MTSGLRYVIQRITLLLVFAVILFAAVGTLRWAQGWIYLVALFFIIRTALEDQTLRMELEGYESYTQQTHYRLLPGRW